MIRTAASLIDMGKHKGEHPRIGATDVCPLVPIAGITMEEVKTYARKLAFRVGNELNIPVYLYEHSASREYRRNLANIRSGEYEGLLQKMQLPKWQPDFGNGFNASTGATVLGARDFLIAYNVNINSVSAEIAHNIACDIRESGRWIQLEDGTKSRKPGQCKFLKAIGWYIEEYGRAQISMNLINYPVTGLHDAFEACKRTAKKYDVIVTGSELIGLVPLDAILNAGRFYLERDGQSATSRVENIIQIAADRLGLSEIAPFNYKKRIIEFLL